MIAAVAVTLMSGFDYVTRFVGVLRSDRTSA